MHKFYFAVDIVATFVLPWVGVIVGWLLCWLWMTVRQLKNSGR